MIAQRLNTSISLYLSLSLSLSLYLYLSIYLSLSACLSRAWMYCHHQFSACESLLSILKVNYSSFILALKSPSDSETLTWSIPAKHFDFTILIYMRKKTLLPPYFNFPVFIFSFSFSLYLSFSLLLSLFLSFSSFLLSPSLRGRNNKIAPRISLHVEVKSIYFFVPFKDSQASLADATLEIDWLNWSTDVKPLI